MRTFRLTLWHMLLVVAIVVGTVVALLAGVQAFMPAWQAPWLLPLLVVVALDGAITQWLVERERRNWTEQGTIRLAEAALLLICVRIASLAAEDRPLSVLELWLRDPLLFFSGRFAEYLLIALIVWGMTALLAHALFVLDADAAIADLDNLQIEKAAVLEDRATALARFDKLWMAYVCFALVGAGLSLQRMPLTSIVRSTSALWPLLGVLASMLGGLLLYSQASLSQQRYRWQLDQIVIESEVAQRWRRASWLLIIIALLVGIAGGSLVHNVPPPPPLIPVLNLLTGVLSLLVAFIMVLFGLLMLPLILLFGWLSGEAVAPPRIQFPPLQETVQTGERPLIPALIFWGCIALLIVIAGVHYLRQRQDVRDLLGRWRGWRWLMRLWSETWADVHGWSELAWTTLQQRLRRPRRGGRSRRGGPSDSRAQVRMLYRRMLAMADRQGVPRQPAQTPYEFNSVLGTQVPSVQADAQELTHAYVVAEYGPQLPPPDVVRRARQVWRRIQRVLSRLPRRKQTHR